MITEDYVSFETAKLLKEKGFDAETEHELWYVVEKFSTGCHWNSCTYNVGDTTREYDEKYCIAMPTLQMAMKWLREVHNISVEPLVDFGSGDEYWWTADVGYIKKDGLINELCGYNSYEEACEAGIKYCLENLI